ncbi:MAG: flagellar biosynthesis anti-sigma factor FlgM [Desulfovibrionaceae bacterium]
MEIKNLVGELNPYKKQIEEGARAKGVSRSATTRSGTDTTDTVSLSDEARLRGAALSEASKSPDTRTEKVQQLREQVRNGTYTPDIRKAAANLIRDDLSLLSE